MIHLVHGNLFESDAQAIVNPVNCVGVMGAGLAARFKQFYPEMFEDYKRTCDEKHLKPGKVHVWTIPMPDRTADPTHLDTWVTPPTRYIINLPTKLHWKDPSQMKYVTSGVSALITTMLQRNIHSVAMPALGCGLGGLQWEQVQPAIIAQFQQRAPDKVVFLYEPKA